MNIIEHGNTFNEIMCEYCGCKFSYCKNDIKTKRFYAVPFTPYDLDYTWSDIVTCPECNGIVVLSDTQTDFLKDYKEQPKQTFLEKVKLFKRKD